MRNIRKNKALKIEQVQARIVDNELSFRHIFSPNLNPYQFHHVYQKLQKQGVKKRLNPIK